MDIGKTDLEIRPQYAVIDFLNLYWEPKKKLNLLKGEFTNFDNVILNDAPRWYTNIIEG